MRFDRKNRPLEGGIWGYGSRSALLPVSLVISYTKCCVPPSSHPPLVRGSRAVPPLSRALPGCEMYACHAALRAASSRLYPLISGRRTHSSLHGGSGYFRWGCGQDPRGRGGAARTCSASRGIRALPKAAGDNPWGRLFTVSGCSGGRYALVVLVSSPTRHGCLL